MFDDNDRDDMFILSRIIRSDDLYHPLPFSMLIALLVLKRSHMKKIVAPIDFSEVSISTAHYAAHLAASLGLELELVHVSELPMAYSELIPEVIDDYNLQERIDAQLQRVVPLIKNELAGNLKIQTTILRGSPLYEITNYCNEQMPYAIVIGPHSNSSFSRFLLGSTTVGVMNSCRCPVVIVPKEYTWQPPQRIGLASDFHEMNAEIPSGMIETLVEALGAKLEILHVDNNEPEEVLAAGSEHISQLFGSTQPAIKVLQSPFVEETLLNYSAEKHLDMLVVVPRKHSWIDLLVKHQHTKNIALHAGVPVLVVK